MDLMYKDFSFVATVTDRQIQRVHMRSRELLACIRLLWRGGLAGVEER